MVSMRSAQRLLMALRRPRWALRRWEYRRRGFDAVTRRGIELVRDGMGYWPYQPLYGMDGDDGTSVATARSTFDRWAAIEPHLPRSGSALDIGTHHGWFAFKMAERGLCAIGVDNTESSVRMAQWLTLRDPTARASFMKLDVGPKTVRHLPEVDVVLCLSVFHNWVRQHGPSYAEEAMRGLSERCRDRMFFETGQCDEESDWAEKLSFMGDSPRTWIEDFLRSLGFERVEHLGAFTGYRMKGARHLMIGTR